MYSRLTHYEIQRRVNALVGASSSNGTGCHSEQRYAWNSLALMVSTVGDECTGRREDDALLHFYSGANYGITLLLFYFYFFFFLLINTIIKVR